MSALGQSVAMLMRQVAHEVVLPHFRNLSDDQKEEKAPDDWVTVADRDAEVRLTEGLAAIDPGTRIVGEEACAANPSLLDGVGTGRLWLIDPIDGTGNYAAGRPPFGVMLALVEEGVPVEGWVLDPLSGRLCHASRGGGARINDERIASRGSGATKPIAALATYFMTNEQRADIAARAEGKLTVVDIPRCAAEQYPRLVLGQNDLSVFERTLPWDHAAGTLFLEEAGGRVARTDGTPYRIGDGRRGLLGASTPELWDMAARLLYG